MYPHKSDLHSSKKALDIWVCCLVLAIVTLLAKTNQVEAQFVDDPILKNEVDEIENSIQTGSAGYAWGDPDGQHAVYAWPFTVVQMGHAIQSYQSYGGSPYFHHGIDMIAPDGTEVYTRSGGQVINVENYQPGWDLYWEVAILDAEGYVWQYHHIDQPTIPQAIIDAYQAWLVDPIGGGYIQANTYIGDIIFWPVESFGYRFNHIHLNILADGDVYLNPLEFHTLLNDTQVPEIQEIGLLNGDTIVNGDIATGNYGLYVRTRDLFLSDVYYLPPYKVEFSIDGEKWVTVWEFHNLPGGASDTNFVLDYYVPNYTCGDYDCRDFYIDLGFTQFGQRVFPSELGEHTIQARIADYNGNTVTGSYSWLVAENLPDNGCSSGNGVLVSFPIMDDLIVTDVNLGINLSHTSRGQVKVTLQSPSDVAATTIIALNSSDTYNNYDLWLDDISANPINDGSNDDVFAPYFDRTARPSVDGSLDSFNGKDAAGIWTVFLCDQTSGVSGTINLVNLEVLGTLKVRILYLPFISR